MASVDEDSEANEPSGQFVQSLARGLAVIRAFDASDPELTLSEVARATGLTRATARRFLLTLLELGYLRTDGKRFALTPRVLELGYSYLSGLSLPEVAQPYLEALSRELGESTSASVLDGGDIVYVARVPTRRIMTIGITIGTRFPAHVTSMGRVMLAALDPAALDAYFARLEPVALTAQTELDPAQLRQALDRARRDGWALVDQELEEGLRSIAAPLKRNGAVVGAINVSTSASTRTLEHVRTVYGPSVVEAAGRISADLDRLRG